MTRLTLRLSEQLHARLVAEARSTGSSLNQLIVEALRGSLGTKNGPPRSERDTLIEALGDLRADPDALVAYLPRYPETELLSQEELQHRLADRNISLSEAIIADREDRQ